MAPKDSSPARPSRLASAVGVAVAVTALAVLAALLIPPAGAVSDIRNSLELRQTEDGGAQPGQPAIDLRHPEKVEILGETDFGNTGKPTAYSSNFRNAINARHFERPRIISEDCEGDEYYFRAAKTDEATDDPYWVFDCGTFFVHSGAKRHIRAEARTVDKEKSRDFDRTLFHRHGQYDCPKSASCGATTEWRTTLRNKKDEA